MKREAYIAEKMGELFLNPKIALYIYSTFMIAITELNPVVPSSCRPHLGKPIG